MSNFASKPLRPLSPNIQIYRPQLTSVLSIANRISGLVSSLGAVGLAARRRVNQEIADFIVAVVAAGRGEPLAPELAMAIVGGINELVLQYIEQDRVEQLQEVVAPASRLVRAVAGSH